LGKQQLSEVRKNASIYYALKQELVSAASAVNTSTSAMSPTLRGVYDDRMDWDSTEFIEFLETRLADVQKAITAVSRYRTAVEAGYGVDYVVIREADFAQFLNN